MTNNSTIIDVRSMPEDWVSFDSVSHWVERVDPETGSSYDLARTECGHQNVKVTWMTPREQILDGRFYCRACDSFEKLVAEAKQILAPSPSEPF